MHLTERGYVFAGLVAALAIAGLWSGDPVAQRLWAWPALALLAGLAFEGASLRRESLTARLQCEAPLLLGRASTAAFLFGATSGLHRTCLEYAPVVPAGFAPLGAPRRVELRGADPVRQTITLRPLRLGLHAWPAMPARLLGRLGLAWWSRPLRIESEVRVSPDVPRLAGIRPAGLDNGERVRRVSGAGAELHQLRPYVPGDPLSRIDWKTTARSGRLITREYSDDQHLDILLAIDAGRRSRVAAAELDRLALFANLAARFAQSAIERDDRIGLVVYADRVLGLSPVDRGTRAVIRLREQLSRIGPTAGESDPLTAASAIRGALRRRGLVVLLTDLDDSGLGEDLARAVRLLSPPHLALVAGIRSTEIAEAAVAEARGWRDPWRALAAAEHQERTLTQIERLRRLGAPVVAASHELLEDSVLAEYLALRQRRRV